jgi:hypothetical protein
LDGRGERVERGERGERGGRGADERAKKNLIYPKS